MANINYASHGRKIKGVEVESLNSSEKSCAGNPKNNYVGHTSDRLTRYKKCLVHGLGQYGV